MALLNTSSSNLAEVAGVDEAMAVELQAAIRVQVEAAKEAAEARAEAVAEAEPNDASAPVTTVAGNSSTAKSVNHPPNGAVEENASTEVVDSEPAAEVKLATPKTEASRES